MASELPYLEAIRRGAHLGLAACFGTPIAPAAPGRGQAPDVAVLAGFTGALCGQLRLAMPHDMALACARRLLGRELAELDADGLKALLDAAATVAGAVANELAREGVNVQLAEPTLGVGGPCDHEEALSLPLGYMNLGIGVAPAPLAWLAGWLTSVVPAA
ncbi:MAG: hypothetical protein JWM80_2989 [Cyanobacteria bacterium RYN_339]|nr:hypothetical protein [Cyanobacteria bacterium RYN_339]